MLDSEKILKGFDNWRISEQDSNKLILVSIANESERSILKLIDRITCEVPLDKSYIQVEKNKIKIELKKEPKYNRMYTSGCFDIFHYGHLNILLKSKELCNHLIVGVSTDDLIEKEKGKRPVIPFEERIRVVKSIGVVDEVIPQVDKNKQKIVDDFNIDAISVGDDWRGRYPKVTCAMEYFKYTPNVSSTILKKALRLAENTL